MNRDDARLKLLRAKSVIHEGRRVEFEYARTKDKVRYVCGPGKPTESYDIAEYSLWLTTDIEEALDFLLEGKLPEKALPRFGSVKHDMCRGHTLFDGREQLFFVDSLEKPFYAKHAEHAAKRWAKESITVLVEARHLVDVFDPIKDETVQVLVHASPCLHFNTEVMG